MDYIPLHSGHYADGQTSAGNGGEIDWPTSCLPCGDLSDSTRANSAANAANLIALPRPRTRANDRAAFSGRLHKPQFHAPTNRTSAIDRVRECPCARPRNRSPHRASRWAICAAAKLTACYAEPHCRSIVVVAVSIGSPACSHGVRAEVQALLTKRRPRRSQLLSGRVPSASSSSMRFCSECTKMNLVQSWLALFLPICSWIGLRS